MASFSTALSITLKHEGGYQALVADRGNYNSLNQLVGTKYGISAKTYEDWINKVPTVEDMKSMTEYVARQIYKTWYWDPLKIDSLTSQKIANQIFDIGVNSGQGNMAKIVQKAINDVKPGRVVVDGKFGLDTRAALQEIINAGKESELNNAIVNQRKAFISGGVMGFKNALTTRAEKYLTPLTAGVSIVAVAGIALFFLMFLSGKK